ISVDHPLPTPSDADVALWGDTLAAAEAFQWRYGRKEVIKQSHNIGLVGQWMRGWNPGSGQDGVDVERELCLFLEDDVVLSHDWSKWLRRAVHAYSLDGGATSAAADPRLFGISLQRQHTVLGETHAQRMGSRTPADVLDAMARKRAAEKEARRESHE